MRSLPVPLAFVALLGGCGEDPARPPRPPAPPPTPGGAAREAVRLEIRVSTEPGHSTRGELHCRGREARASGFLAENPHTRCDRARRLSSLLLQKPDPRRVCAQVYGGPQTAHVEGRLAGRTVDRRFSREDACQIRDWERAAPLLAGAR